MSWCEESKKRFRKFKIENEVVFEFLPVGVKKNRSPLFGRTCFDDDLFFEFSNSVLSWGLALHFNAPLVWVSDLSCQCPCYLGVRVHFRSVSGIRHFTLFTRQHAPDYRNDLWGRGCSSRGPQRFRGILLECPALSSTTELHKFIRIF